MTFYLDASVVDVYLFGLEKEPQRYPDVVALFEAINAEQAERGNFENSENPDSDKISECRMG